MPQMYSSKYSTRTESDHTEIVTIMWNIPNFPVLFDGSKNWDIRIHEYDCEKPIDEDMRFKLNMKFVGKENDLVELYFLAPIPMFLKSSLTICPSSFKEVSIVTNDYKKVQPNKWQFLAALFKRDLTGSDDNVSSLNEGDLDLKFQFIINKDVHVDHSDKPEAQLNHDLESLFNNASFSDVIMKSVEGVEFQAHKAVLATRSAVLKAHFGPNTVESQTNVIECSLQTDVLREVLTYIYTDKSPKIKTMPEQMLAAAEFYQMSRLKQLSEEALFQSLTVDNAIDTLMMADLHLATTLKNKTLEFIIDGHSKLILQTEGYAKLKSVELIKTILEYVIHKGNLGQYDVEDLL